MTEKSGRIRFETFTSLIYVIQFRYTSYESNISINRISIYRISINRMKCSRDEMFDLSKFSSRRKTSVNELVLFCKNYRFFWRKRKCFKIKLKKCCQTFNRQSIYIYINIYECSFRDDGTSCFIFRIHLELVVVKPVPQIVSL